MATHQPALYVNRISVASLEEMLINQYNQDFSERSMDKDEMSAEDRQFLEIMESSATLKEQHYYLGLPFKNPQMIMPNNRHMVEQRAPTIDC